MRSYVFHIYQLHVCKFFSIYRCQTISKCQFDYLKNTNILYAFHKMIMLLQFWRSRWYGSKCVDFTYKLPRVVQWSSVYGQVPNLQFYIFSLKNHTFEITVESPTVKLIELIEGWKSSDNEKVVVSFVIKMTDISQGHKELILGSCLIHCRAVIMWSIFLKILPKDTP